MPALNSESDKTSNVIGELWSLKSTSSLSLVTLMPVLVRVAEASMTSLLASDTRSFALNSAWALCFVEG
jgi:hypothetical protein